MLKVSAYYTIIAPIIMVSLNNDNHVVALPAICIVLQEEPLLIIGNFMPTFEVGFQNAFPNVAYRATSLSYVGLPLDE